MVLKQLAPLLRGFCKPLNASLDHDRFSFESRLDAGSLGAHSFVDFFDIFPCYAEKTGVLATEVVAKPKINCSTSY
jgi:hypothetical protein